MKLALAKIIYWLGVGILFAIPLTMLGSLAWTVIESVPAKNWPIIGIIIGGLAFIAGYCWLWSWANKYIEENK